MENRNKPKTRLKQRYFFGIGTLIARELGCTEKYVRDVLNGHHDDRDTELVHRIKKMAEELVTTSQSTAIPQA